MAGFAVCRVDGVFKETAAFQIVCKLIRLLLVSDAQLSGAVVDQMNLIDARRAPAAWTTGSIFTRPPVNPSKPGRQKPRGFMGGDTDAVHRHHPLAPPATLARHGVDHSNADMTGILNVDKPAGISSAGVVGRVKRLLPRGTKIGHAGTLDPFATGVLLLLIGRATKACEAMMDRPKRYDTTVRLGSTTATDDLESEAVPFPGLAGPPTMEQIQTAVGRFTGPILQQPPAYSALKINGRRACDLVRDGKPVVLAPRRVTVYGIAVVDYRWPDLSLSIDCGRGFYVRSLARELGDALGVGGYLTQLRRTRVGPFDIADAVRAEDLTAENIESLLRPVADSCL